METFIYPDDVLTTAGRLWIEVVDFAIAYSFSVLGAIILIIAGFIVAGALQRWTYRGLGRFPSFDETLRRFLSKVIRYSVLVLVGVTVLAQFGVQTASIIAALGAVGLAIGLALQGTLQNIAAGIMLLVLKPFRVGEYIDAGGIAGTVQEIGLFATELTTFDGVYVLTPNSELWNRAVTNYSRNPTRRHDLAIRIGFEDDINRACDILMELALADKRVLAVPAPETMVTEIRDSDVIVNLRYWTAASDYWSVRFALNKAAKLAFDKNGITIPYPQHSVHYTPRDASSAPAK
ncbi:mechanosensitive ion channel [Chelativorans sp. SCAU2101]|jgi:small conductance mechanosensitive channel|uniref:Small-conductance mechanosensitive channel n=1 Tax=Chelativorans petroleitrophicus TaxID=2975484 RepID=A0A9X3B6V0_9HYPH|nr:mechanosensitive ion channel domain-containing protein [Chelativorans petroleitrophicus]MCT8990908.1 mechanosensitive ion channel [Chelativorans petroleitrophicus]